MARKRGRAWRLEAWRRPCRNDARPRSPGSAPRLYRRRRAWVGARRRAGSQGRDRRRGRRGRGYRQRRWDRPRSEEHTSELQSLMRISYAVFCLKKKKKKKNNRQTKRQSMSQKEQRITK